MRALRGEEVMRNTPPIIEYEQPAEKPDWFARNLFWKMLIIAAAIGLFTALMSLPKTITMWIQ